MRIIFINFLIFIYISIIFGKTDSENHRIITVGGSVTEIVYSLGLGNQVVAVDQSSTIPDAISDLPQVGYIRHISAEGILSLMPSLILTTSDIGPDNAIKQLKESGLKIKIFDSPKNYQDVIKLVTEIAKTLNVIDKAYEITSTLRRDYDIIEKISLSLTLPPRIAFFMDATNSGSFNTAGDNTRANYLIELIGGKNIYKHIFKRYNKISSESILDGNPDVILIACMYGNSLIENEIYNNAIYSSINAVKKKQVLTIDLGSHLTFGTNIANAAKNLMNLIDVIPYESDK